MYSDENAFHDTKVRVYLEVKVYSSGKNRIFFPFPFVIFPFSARGSTDSFPCFPYIHDPTKYALPVRILEDLRSEKPVFRIKPQVFIAAVFKNHALNAKYAPSGLENELYRDAREPKRKKKSREFTRELIIPSCAHNSAVLEVFSHSRVLSAILRAKSRRNRI